MIEQKEYQARRKKLAAQLPDDAIAVIPATNEILRNGDAHYPFRQDSNFYYLTGFAEPDALLLISGGPKSESYLFNRMNDPLQEQWNGKRLGQEGARNELGVNAAYPLESIPKRLPEFLANKRTIYYAFGRNPAYENHIMQVVQMLKTQIRRGITAPDIFRDLEPIISEMRLFKSESEIAVMRRAAAISVEAHKRAMKICKQANYEYELEAELLYEFRRQGCRSEAYTSIVGNGENTCILHYIENDKPLQSGELILIDAGGEFENYAADITRTFPRNGQFNDQQRAIYELVLKAQKAGVACVQPGCAWNEIQNTIVHILTEGLCELGLLQGNVNDLIAKEQYKAFYMHNSGHWLGLDVHDCGQYKINNEWRPLEPGMVLTVEPGIYIKAGMEKVDSRWWNIGVRIEDDILVTEKGHENLTSALPVEIDEIEALMRG